LWERLLAAIKIASNEDDIAAGSRSHKIREKIKPISTFQTFRNTRLSKKLTPCLVESTNPGSIAVASNLPTDISQTKHHTPDPDSGQLSFGSADIAIDFNY
jgi:hypothetical protein